MWWRFFMRFGRGFVEQLFPDTARITDDGMVRVTSNGAIRVITS